VVKYAYVALASVALSVAVSAAADAQQGPITSGGDVTAEEVTPLPPVIVESPSQPITEKKSKGKVASPVVGTPAPQATAAQAQQSGEGLGAPGVGIYTLGQLDMIGGSTITNEAMWTFNKNSVDQAVGILPGVTMTNTDGSRNEKDILVRGFDRFRVPLYEDGVRIYLPYDNRLDFGRFLTPDLSEVQVAKNIRPASGKPWASS
jgi:iron complex outermembrane recepter protein